MEKIIPLKFSIDKVETGEGNNPLIETNVQIDNPEYIITAIKEIYSIRNLQSDSNNVTTAGTRSIVTLESGLEKIIWNLQKYGGKLICPVLLDDINTENIVYAETDNYKMVCLETIYCDDNDNGEGRILDKGTGEEKFPLGDDDIYSSTFKCGFAISKYPENNGNRFSGIIFGSKIGLHGCVKAWGALLKQVFESHGFKFYGTYGISRQKISAINDSIKKMVIAKNIQGRTMGGGLEEELTLELTLKGKTVNFTNLLNRLLGRDSTGTENLEILEDFRSDGMNEDNISVYSGSNEKKLSIDVEGNELIAYASDEFASIEGRYGTLEEYKNVILQYLNSLAND